MNIVSYRGPGMAGGVSSALLQLCEQQEDTKCSWWHIKESSVSAIDTASKNLKTATTLRPEIIKGHYRYCHEFIWPLMHDMPEYAWYSGADRKNYVEFNNIMTTSIGRRSANADWHFVQDYQLALVPNLLDTAYGIDTSVFWHVPWPKNVRPIYVAPIREIVRGLLGARLIGFHTEEYASNFLRFVENYLPERHVDDVARRVTAMPLGVDIEYWNQLASSRTNIYADPRFARLGKLPYILSVDRADYTKGISERMDFIRTFFECYPEWIGKVNFVQVCARTRTGIDSYEEYWSMCKEKARDLCLQFGNDSWQPLIWLEDPVFPKDLALLYRNAACMLVNPIRDGLNLTAKEFVICQRENPGVLLLSPGAGAFHELKHFAVTVNPLYPAQAAHAIEQALTMSQAERALRVNYLKIQLESNPLETWWRYFCNQASNGQRAAYKLSRV